MKRIVLFVLPIIIFGLSLTAAADSKQSGKIKLSNHVVVAGTQLQPGEYVVRWDGSGPDVQVRFVRDGDEVASVPGTLHTKKSDYEVATTTHLHEDGATVLTEIAFSKVTLVLPHSETSTVNE